VPQGATIFVGQPVIVDGVRAFFFSIAYSWYKSYGDATAM
jgi:hypothetical protein